LRFALKAAACRGIGELIGKQLHRNATIQPGVERLVYDAHSTFTKLTLNSVITDFHVQFFGLGINSWPSPRTHLIHVAAGRPSFMGWPVMVTFVPTLKSLTWMPERVSVDGPSASKPQVVIFPSSPFTSIRSQEWGLVYWNSFTTPVTVISFASSNMVPE